MLLGIVVEKVVSLFVLFAQCILGIVAVEIEIVEVYRFKGGVLDIFLIILIYLIMRVIETK